MSQSTITSDIAMSSGANESPLPLSGSEPLASEVDTAGTVVDNAEIVVDGGKSQLRFFSIGPSSYRVTCPLCCQSARTETVQMSGSMGQLSCLLSVLSCCFPIFALTFVYNMLQSRLKSKRVFCSSCGGHLGYHYRPS